MTCLSVHELVWGAPMVVCRSGTKVPPNASSNFRPGGTVLAMGPLQNSFQATIGYLNLPTYLWVIRGGETVSNSVFKHDIYKLVIAKMGSAITYDSTKVTESGEERFKKFVNNSGVVGKMISREILGSFCVNYFEFELLKEENPPEQSRLGIFFSKQIFEGGVIRIHNAFVQDEAKVFFMTLPQDRTYGKVACIAHKLKG
ncbi:hypothetical protein Tco_0228528 [Tanacetum coccineum]